MNKRIGSKLAPYLFILPCAVLIMIILIYPVLTGFAESFQNKNLLIPQQTKFIGVDNFSNLFHDKMFILALIRSVVWTLIILVLEMAFGLFFAVILNKDIYAKKFFRCILLIPWVIPNAIAGIIWKWFLNESYGMMNYILKSLGIIHKNLPWLSDPTLAAVSTVIIITWKCIPFVAVTLLAGLQAIPGSLYEAAKVDGAGDWQCFINITVPMIKKIALITAILTSIWNFNQLDIIQVVTRGGPGEATITLPVYIYRLFMQTFQLSYASAAAVIMMIVMTVPTIIYTRKLLKE